MWEGVAIWLFAQPMALAQDPSDPPATPEEEEDIEEITVLAPTVSETETRAATTLSAPELARSAGEDLGETLSQIPGVTASRGSADTSKPIIRGQTERRLLVLFDGVRHESQKWGLDHAPEIDPFAASRISVIRGAAGVRYGPDAIGGVILVEPPEMANEPGLSGRASLIGISNGPRVVSALSLDASPVAIPQLALRLEGDYGRGAAQSAPDYVLGNTGSEDWNAGARVGWQSGLARLESAWHHYDFEGGVCYCAKGSTPDDLIAQSQAEIPLGAESWTHTFRIDRPKQAVTHDLALLRGTLAGLRGSLLQGTYAFQINQRQEYDQVRGSIEGPQYDFVLRTHSLDLVYENSTFRLPTLDAALKGGLGLSGSLQENVYAGLPLVPNFRSLQGSLFGWQRLTKGPVAVEAGARYDSLGRTVFLTPSAFDRALAGDLLSDEDCTATPDAARCASIYHSGSAALGSLWEIAPDRANLRLDLSTASRFPSADELYMYGSAPTSPVWAVGDPSLGVETTVGASLTLDISLDWITGQASVYAQNIDDYIAFAPALDGSGDPLVDVTIQGAFPRYAFRAIDARFHGAEGGILLGPQAPLRVSVQGSLVRGNDREQHEPLPLVPPDRLSGALRLVPAPGALRESFAEISLQHIARQTRVSPGADIAPPPDAATLLAAGLGTEIGRGDRALMLGLEGSNLLNTRYREYTSLLRYFADEPGREVRLRVSTRF